MVGDLAVDRGTLTARIASLPTSIVRGKGIVSFGTDPARWVLQKVGARTTCTREPSLDVTFDERGSQLVFIGLPAFDHDATIIALATDLGLRLMPSEGDR